MTESLRSKYESWTKSIIREVAPPITKQAKKPPAGENYATRESPKGHDPQIFAPSTVLLDGGWAKWNLEVPKHVRDNLVDMSLRIETIRTHGMLHSPDEGGRGRIYVNGDLVDEILLVKPHLHGEDFGVDTRRPFPVLPYIRRCESTQTIKLWVNQGTLWDVDRVTLEPVILRKETKPWVTMILGAIISAVAGGMVNLVT